MKSVRRLSIPRLLVVLLVSAGASGLLYLQVHSVYARLTEPSVKTWFAPYVDTTVVPTYQFEDPLVSPARYFVLGFIVADPRYACSPSWGSYFNLVGADQELDLARRIVRLRARGGDIVVSFGGAANQELSVACTNPTKLLDAYRHVVDRYGVKTLDFDIEGAALTDTAANQRRALVLRQLQQWSDHAGRHLDIWLTLPVTPSGLDSDGVALVREMLAAKVQLAGVNAMIMDYGSSLPPGTSMWQAGQSALEGVFRQVRRAYRRTGVVLTTHQAWARIGATPMIGQNDIAGEYFTPSDARALYAFARQTGLGRVSMWSANRDAPCSVNANLTRVSDVCSGVNQQALAYTWDFNGLNAKLPDHVAAPSSTIAERPPSRDNPLLSPYPIWDQTSVYQAGSKVVWHGEVYQAKWWTLGTLPDETVDHPWDTPWRDLGPVLPSDAPPGSTKTVALAPWSSSEVYLEGDKVTFRDWVFQAKWWTQGQAPQITPLRPTDAPWQRLHPVPKHKRHASGHAGKKL